MATASPTYADQRWGSRAHQVFDYYQNPTPVYAADGVTRANPLVIYRHAGTGTQSYRALQNSSFEAYFYFFQWLLGDDPATEPAEHWDVLSISTGQQKHKAADLPRSLQMYVPETIWDMQLGIASVKALHQIYGFDPKRVHGFGYSHGAFLIGLSQLWTPMTGVGGTKTQIGGKLWNGTYDSTLRSVILTGTVADVRKPGGVDRFHYSHLGPIFGVSDLAATEWDAVPASFKAACSIIAFMENRDLAHYPGFFSSFTQAGDHLYPIGDPGRAGSDPHDSVQHDNLMQAMATAGVLHGGRLITNATTEIVNSLYPSGTSPSVLPVYRELARWLGAQNVITM